MTKSGGRDGFLGSLGDTFYVKKALELFGGHIRKSSKKM